jgi:hypothetical protein
MERKSASEEAEEHHSSFGLTQLAEEIHPEVMRLMRIMLSLGNLSISSSNRTVNEAWFTFSILPRSSPLRQCMRTEFSLWDGFSNSKSVCDKYKKR